MSDLRFCGVYSKATKTWLQQHAHKQFGPMYQDATPKAWADTFLACHYQQVFTEHICRSVKHIAAKRTQRNMLSAQLTQDPRFIHIPAHTSL
eukprot:10240409-Ditylum_brightwellii.AAC.1